MKKKRAPTPLQTALADYEDVAAQFNVAARRISAANRLPSMARRTEAIRGNVLAEIEFNEAEFQRASRRLDLDRERPDLTFPLTDLSQAFDVARGARKLAAYGAENAPVIETAYQAHVAALRVSAREMASFAESMEELRLHEAAFDGRPALTEEFKSARKTITDACHRMIVMTRHITKEATRLEVIRKQVVGYLPAGFSHAAITGTAPRGAAN